MLQVSAAGFAQKLTYHQKQARLEQIFKEITKQTGYEVFYADKGIDAARTIDADFKNATLEEVLEKSLGKLPLSYAIEDKSIVIRIKEKSLFDKLVSYIAAIDVTGKVLDEQGQPLPNATIKVKGTNRTTFTNEKGEFQFKNVDEDAVLQVYFLGYKSKEITASDLKKAGTVLLEVKAGELQEVNVTVNTGYQTLPKERSTGSFTFVDNAMLNQQVGPNILNRLEGVANGVSFDKSGRRPNVTVRGLSSINGPTNPLIILDNFPYEGDLRNINPNDIENISILKDAAAASIWGARAGNGVIVLTSKKGALNQPLKISFNSNVTITSKPDLFDFRQMSTSDYIDIEQFLYSKGRYNALINDKNKPGLSEVVELLIANKANVQGEIDALRNRDVRNEASKYLYGTAVDQQYALNIQGGSAKSTYNVSGGYDRNLSTLSDTYSRINLRAANTFKPIEKLQISTNLYYTKSDSKSGKPGYSPNVIGNKLPPYTGLADDNGNSLPINIYRKTYIEGPGMDKLLDWKYYPLEDYKHSTLTNNLQSILASAGLRYEVIQGLNVDLKYQYENQQIKGKRLNDVESFYARDLINQASVLDAKTGLVKYVVPNGGILTNTAAGVVSQNGRLQADYNKTFGDHTISALAGAEVRSIRSTSNGFNVYGYNDETLGAGKVDYATKYKNFINGSLENLSDGPAAEERLNNYVSYFGNASYTYKGKYTLSGSVRQDKSNIFGVKTNDKGVPLWSAGASWNISDESFYQVNFLPYLKLRTTYGVSGNLDSRRSAVATFYASAMPAFYTFLPQSNVDQYPNPDLRWEKINQFNVGIDFGLVNNVISGSLEYYQKKGVDLFGLAEMDYTTTGVGSMTKNVANMKGRGIDLELRSKIIDRQFKWTQQFNFSYNTNKVTKYFRQSDQGSDYVNDGFRISPLEGQPVYAIISQRWAGLDPLTGDPQGYLNGVVSKDYKEFIGAKSKLENLVFSGSATPVVFGNFSNTVSYKNFALTVNVTYKMGYYFRRASIDYTQVNKLSPNGWHSDYALRWQKPGDEQHTSVPSFVYPNNDERNSFYNASEALVSKGDHIRLQFVNLSYSLNKSQWTKLPVQQVQFFTNASNLGILWRANKYKIDPDYNNSLYPKASFSLGLRADF